MKKKERGLSEWILWMLMYEKEEKKGVGFIILLYFRKTFIRKGSRC
jgi:hypothetical protein